MVAAEAAYFDASALVKLVVDEPETEPLRVWLTPTLRVVTSRIGLVEVSRAARRFRPELGRSAVVLGSAVDVVELDAEIAAEAATIAPSTLRSLDAIHLATAVRLRPAVSVFVAYDRRLLAAARERGLVVEHPGMAA